MNRIMSKEFEKILKDKYDVWWDRACKWYTDGDREHIGSVGEHELIGIMVSELYSKFKYEALRKAIEGVYK